MSRNELTAVYSGWERVKPHAGGGLLSIQNYAKKLNND